VLIVIVLMEGYLFHNLCLELSCSPSYNITVTQVREGTTSIDVEFASPFDSGTSFMCMVDPAYSRVTEKASASEDEDLLHHSL